MRASIGLALLLLLAPATSLLAAPPRAERDRIDVEEAPADDPDGAGITYSRPDNPRMVAARRLARDSLPGFLMRLARPAADERDFMVKFDLAGSREFIWADDLRLDNGRLSGRLINTPIHADFRYGQRVDIPQEAIADWGYFRGRVMQGNFTTRVQLEAMTPDDARQVRETYGW